MYGIITNSMVNDLFSAFKRVIDSSIWKMSSKLEGSDSNRPESWRPIEQAMP
jgi:hypothetical protein